MKKLNPIYLFFARILYHMPRWFKSTLGWCIGVSVFDVLRFRRGIINENLERAFPGMPAAKKRRLGRKSLITLGHLLVEFTGLPFMDESWVDRNITFEGMEHYQKAGEKGKGVLLLGLHMGSGECVLGSMCLKGMPIVLIGKRLRTPSMDRLLFESRARTGMEFIPTHGKSTAMHILKALRKEKNVLFVLDQHIYPPYGVATTFFGHRVGTGFGLALFAQKTQAPVIPLHSFRDSSGRNHVVFGPEIPFVAEDTKQETLEKMTQTYNHILEDIIRKHPDQWLWIHRRWKPFDP